MAGNVAGNVAPDIIIYQLSTSGKPATDVSIDSNPASADAEITIAQLTFDKTADVPIVEIAVCATVLTALIPAAFAHLIVSFFTHFDY